MTGLSSLLYFHILQVSFFFHIFQISKQHYLHNLEEPGSYLPLYMSEEQVTHPVWIGNLQSQSSNRDLPTPSEGPHLRCLKSSEPHCPPPGGHVGSTMCQQLPQSSGLLILVRSQSLVPSGLGPVRAVAGQPSAQAQAGKDAQGNVLTCQHLHLPGRVLTHVGLDQVEGHGEQAGG